MNLAYNILNSLGNGFGEGGMAKVDLRGITEMPTKFALSQNYPNPFNPTTVIRYDLPYQSEVDLTVYNLLGQKVATLVNETQPAGYHHVNWNVRNSARAELTSGIYFYRLSAKNIATGQTFVENRKMVLVK